MTREEMISKLSSITVAATPIVMTMDMGLQYDFITAKGAGTSLGNIGEWPAYKFHAINPAQWNLIRNRLEQNVLTEADFDGTDIGLLIQQLHNIYGDIYPEYYEDLNETLEALKDLPDTLPDEFYCMIDVRNWGDRPTFFKNRREFEEAFRDMYCYWITEWDEMDDEDLKYWYERLSDDLSGLSMIDYTEEEAECDE